MTPHEAAIALFGPELVAAALADPFPVPATRSEVRKLSNVLAPSYADVATLSAAVSTLLATFDPPRRRALVRWSVKHASSAIDSYARTVTSRAPTRSPNARPPNPAKTARPPASSRKSHRHQQRTR